MTNEQLYLAEEITDYIRENNYLNGRDMRTLAQLRESVVCVDSPIGEHRCYVDIIESRGPGNEPEIICVDTCLQHEIHELRTKHNINTIGCCCGHGRKQGYIQVSPQSVQKMYELGYEQLPEQSDGQGKWCFKPKTYFLQPVSNSYKFEVNDLVNRFTPPDWSCTTYATMMSNHVPNTAEPFKNLSKPFKSNADRIRAMSDEELAKMFLTHDEQICRHCPSDEHAEKCNADFGKLFVGCDACWLDWLRQEVPESDD